MHFFGRKSKIIPMCGGVLWRVDLKRVSRELVAKHVVKSIIHLLFIEFFLKLPFFLVYARFFFKIVNLNGITWLIFMGDSFSEIEHSCVTCRPITIMSAEENYFRPTLLDPTGPLRSQYYYHCYYSLRFISVSFSFNGLGFDPWKSYKTV